MASGETNILPSFTTAVVGAAVAVFVAAGAAVSAGAATVVVAPPFFNAFTTASTSNPGLPTIQSSRSLVSFHQPALPDKVIHLPYNFPVP
mgnify:CR=1 FL=1